MQPKLPILDLYVLSLLDRGLRSMYELQKIGGLSLGASTPAIRRLLKARMIRQDVLERTGKRVRFHFELTAEGNKQAKLGWRDWLSQSRLPTDLDSLLRIVDMAMTSGQSAAGCSALLVQAAEARESDARIFPSDNNRIRSSTSFLYPALRAQCDSRRVAAEAAALREIVAILGKRKSHRNQPAQRSDKRTRNSRS